MPNQDILVVTDAQIKPTSNLNHIKQLAKYIWQHKPKYIVCIGDMYDFPSLSTYRTNKEKESAERLTNDLNAGTHGLREILAFSKQREAKRKQANPYNPTCHFIMGNHENRLKRFIAEHPVLEGLVDLEGMIEREGWIVHDYLKPVVINDIVFRHNLVHPHSGRVVGGSIDNRLNKTPYSFCVGHEQTYLFGRRQNVLGKPHFGIVAGSFYIEDEHYRMYENTEHRGFVHLQSFTNRYGYLDYDVNFVAMERLMRMKF